MASKENSHLSSLDERVYQDIRDMIVQGELEAGKQIVQEDLADRLGVSRTPLRKAIATLTQENFLEMNARGVAYVRSFDDEELTSIWEIRAVLEGLVCRLAARRAKPQHVAYLRSLLTSAAEQITPEDWTAYREADTDFHSYLAEVVDGPLLTNILDSFQILSLTLAQGLLRPPEETLPEHLEILDALEEEDADRAERAMVRHIRNSIQHVKTSKVATDGVLPDNFMEVVEEAVASLEDELQETILVARQEGEGMVIVHRQNGQRMLRIAIKPDRQLPLHATAAGKVLLAWKDSSSLQRLLDAAEMEKFTPDTMADIDVLRGTLKEVHSKGYAVEDEEHEVGIKSIAAPIWSNGRVVAALAVLAPTTRLDAERCQNVASKVMDYANTISNQL